MNFGFTHCRQRGTFDFKSSLWQFHGDYWARIIRLSDRLENSAFARRTIKSKYQAYGFRTADLLKNLSDHFRNPAQIRYEMNKMKARYVISKPNNKSFYRVTETGWKWLWLEICSVNHLKSPMISRIMKKQVLNIAKQPSQIEKAYKLIQEGLYELTQWLAVIS